LTLITDKLGKLPEADMDFITSEKAKRFMRKLPDKPVASLRRQFPGTPNDALDLLGKMLQIHPKKRITVEEALQHPFLEQLHSPDDEPVCESTFDWTFEDEKLHRVRLQELIWEEVGDFRPGCLPVPTRRDGTRGGPGKTRQPKKRHYHA
jgi:serine/threonine protein kinase